MVKNLPAMQEILFNSRGKYRETDVEKISQTILTVVIIELVR